MGKERKKSRMHIHIPEDIIVHILIRLPVKTLLRFKSVCKLWQSLISDPNFSLSTQGRARKALICSSLLGKTFKGLQKFFYSLDDQLSHLQKLPNPSGFSKISFVKGDKFQILGCCSGLVLLYISRSVFLWNPSTGASREVPQLNGLIEDSVGYGICFDESLGDYKAVVINTRFNNTSSSVAHVASLRSQTVRTDIIFPYTIISRGPEEMTKSGVLANGHLHWLVTEEGNNNAAVSIVYFDETTNRFNNLPMPDLDQTGSQRIPDLRVLGGCLCILISFGTNEEILVMREHGVKESWTKWCMESWAKLYIFPPFVYGKWCSLWSDKVLLVAWHCSLSNYYVKEKSLKNTIYIPSPQIIDTVPVEYVESLASVD